MGICDQLLCSIAAPGVEVVTVRAPDGQVVSELHGGRLDGERFAGKGEPGELHEQAVTLARLAARPLGRRRSFWTVA